jgi:hypothetical protein
MDTTIATVNAQYSQDSDATSSVMSHSSSKLISDSGANCIKDSIDTFKRHLRSLNAFSARRIGWNLSRCRNMN